MQKQDNIPHNLFAKFFSGEITESEQNKMDKFIEEHPNNEKIFEEYQQIWSAETDNEFEDKTETALSYVKNQIKEPPKVISINRNRNTWLKIASAIIIVFGLSYFFTNNLKTEDIQFVSIETGNEIKEHKLADGSIVWLNKNSKIEFPEKFSKNKRLIKMTGEAYFIVAHNKQKPFIVETQNTTTEVLGTEFNLKSFDNQQNVEVVLSKGKVKFTDTKSNVYELMKPNDKITLSKKGRKFKKETIKNANYLSWKTQELIFNNMKLGDVAKILSEHYNIDVRADTLVKDTIFNSSLPFNKLEDVLTTIKLTVGINVDSTNGEIVFRK